MLVGIMTVGLLSFQTTLKLLCTAQKIQIVISCCFGLMCDWHDVFVTAAWFLVRVVCPLDKQLVL